MKWIKIKDRLPEEYVSRFLRWEYENGNTGRAVGCIDDGEWEIQWADDYPDGKDITHWLEEDD